MLELLNSLHDFDSLRKLVTKLRDYPVFENPLTSEEQAILGDSERIMSPIKIFLEQATQPQSAMPTQPLSTLLENREPSEAEVAEAQADLSRSERQLAEQEEQSRQLLRGFLQVKKLIEELRQAYFSGA